MRAVLYAYDLEPITIIDVPHEAMGYLRKHGIVRVYVPTYPDVMPMTLSEAFNCQHKIVVIRAEKFVFW